MPLLFADKEKKHALGVYAEICMIGMVFFARGT